MKLQKESKKISRRIWKMVPTQTASESWLARRSRQVLAPLAREMARTRTTARLAQKASKLAGKALGTTLGWQEGSSLQAAADRAEAFNYASLVLQRTNAKITGELLSNIEELLPEGTEISTDTRVAFARYIAVQTVYEEAEREIQGLIDSGADQETIDTASARANANLESLSANFNSHYQQLAYESSKNLSKALHVYQILKYTPEGVRNQQEMTKYCYFGNDGQWHLKPEAMEIDLTPEMARPYSEENPNGHNLEAVLDYKGVQYGISTAGYRSKSNTHFPWDGNSNFGFFEEAITAYSQNLTLALMAERDNADLQGSISSLKAQVALYREVNEIGAEVKDAEILAILMNEDNNQAAIDGFASVCGQLEKLAGGEVRFNTPMYQELFTRVAAAMGITVHTPPLEGKSLTSIWMASFLIFKNDYDMGNFMTSSHARADYACSKDLSGEGAQFLPEVSVNFAAVNKWVVNQIKTKGFKIKVAAANDPKIKRDIDGSQQYLDMLKTSVLTEENLALVQRAIQENDYTIIQDCVSGCMGPIMAKLFEMAGVSDAVSQLNRDYDPFQAGIGKAVVGASEKLLDKDYQVRATLPTLKFEDEGVDASLQVVVERMYYKHHLKDAKIGQVVSNTDPDGDRLVVGQVMENNAAMKAELDEFGVKYIELDSNRLFCYYSPNKMFLMTTAFYLDQLVTSGNLKKGDTAVVIKTAQTSYAFNEFCEAAENKYGIKIVCIEPTVGFKEIASTQRDIEGQIKANEDRAAAGQPKQDIIVTDALGHEHNLGTGNIQLVTASEESGGQEIAPPGGIISENGRFALGNREKSAGVGSFLSIVFGANLSLKKMTVLDYWKGLIDDFNLTFIQDERHDEKLFDPGEPNPVKYKAAEAEGNQRKQLNNGFWWNLARSYEEGKLSLDDVKGILKEAFPELSADRLNGLREIKPVLTAGVKPEDRAKDGVYLLFEDCYIAIRPSGTDPKIKGYYSGKFSPVKGLEYAKAMASYIPSETPAWQQVDYYATDVYA